MFDNESTPKKAILSSLLGIGASVILSLALILISSLLLLFSEDPSALYAPIALSVLYVSSAAGGFTSRFFGERIISGLFSGIGLTLLILFASQFFGKGESTSPVSTIIGICMVFVTHFCGALICNLYMSRRKRRKRHIPRR